MMESGDGYHPVVPLGLEVEAHGARVEVAAVADGLHVHIPLQGHAEDGGSCWWNSRMALPRWVTERTPASHTFHTLVVSRAAVAHGADDAHGVEAGISPGTPGISGARVV